MVNEVNVLQITKVSQMNTGQALRFCFPLVVLVFQAISLHPVFASEVKECQSTREYITSLKFLRSHEEFSIKESDARAIAEVVSKGCNGAAARFVQVMNLLVKSGLGTLDSLKWSQKFALSDDEATDSFITIFRNSFLKDQLDLDIHSSVKLALALSIEFDGNRKHAREDFEDLTQFCIRTEGLNYPKPRCAKLAARITQMGERFDKPLARVFKEVYEFLRETAGKDTAISESIVISEKVTEAGPLAAKNFKQAYDFAISKSGLEMNQKEAIVFASDLASRSYFDEGLRAASSNEESEPKR